MSLTDTTVHPALLDDWPELSASAGDKLNTLGKEHDAFHDKLAKGLKAAQRITAGPLHVNVRGQGGVGNGGNDSAAITATYNATPDGAVMRFPEGVYGINPGTVALLSSRRIEGDGKYNSWLKLLSDTAGPAIDLNITGGGPSPRTQYGPQVRGIGLDLTLAPSATGFRLAGNTAWAHLDDVLVEGGAISLDSQAPNCWITNYKFINATTAFVKAIEAGLELHMTEGIMEVSPGVTLNKIMDVPLASGGIKGAIYITTLAVNNIGTVLEGIAVYAPNGSSASAPLRCHNVTIDNLAGPGYNLINVTDAQIIGGWVNCAAGTTNGAIRFYGGGAHTVIGVQQLNGGSSGGCTYDFAGGAPAGIVLLGNAPVTGPIYRLSATGKPEQLHAADRISTTAAIENVTNDPEGLRLACATRLWTPQVQAQRLYIREGGTNPPRGYGVLVNGLATINHSAVTANTRVKVTLEHPVGTMGTLCSAIGDNVAGTSFLVKSLRDATTVETADQSYFYWEMWDPA